MPDVVQLTSLACSLERKMGPVYWALVTGSIILFLLHSHWKFSYFKRIGIPADTALPLFGHYRHFMKKGFVESLQDMRQRHGPVYGIFLGSKPVIIIADADMLKEILVRNFSHFQNRQGIAPDPKIFKLELKIAMDSSKHEFYSVEGISAKFHDYPLNKAVNRLEGARWKHVRNTITPAFSASKMKKISVLINNCCDNLIKHMNTCIATNPDIEVKGLYGNMTLDAIAKGAFGLEIDSQDNPNSPFVKHAKAIVDVNLQDPRVLIAFLLPHVAPIFNYFRIGLTPPTSKQFFLDITAQVLKLRKEGKKKGVDILQLMADAQENHDHAESKEIPELAGHKDKGGYAIMKKGLTLEELMAQAVVFFMAGYSTMNVALSVLSYSLATNPDLQEKLYSEIREVAPTPESLSYDAVNKMEYLEMFVSETLRLYPPAPLADRVCTEDITINNIKFTKGSTLFYNSYSLHHDPKYWEDPEKFDPERFSKDNKDKIHPFAFLPFGTGPRNCIGMRFAVLVVKTTLARVVQKFRFEPCEKTQIPLKVGKKGVIPDEGITLRVVSR